MEAIIVGIKKSEFTKEGEKIKSTRLYVNFAGENTEGFETGSLGWNEIKKGPPPLFALGEVIEIEKAGDNYYKFPGPKLSEKFNIRIEAAKK